MMTNLSTKWFGPYSIIPIEEEPLLDWIATSKEALRPGVYLWTAKVGDEYRVNYIGMSTNSITARTMEHISRTFGVNTVAQPKYFREGIKKDDLFCRSRMDWKEVRDRVLPDIVEYLREIRMFFAPLDVEDQPDYGKVELERIESALITQVRNYESDDQSRRFLSNNRLSRRIWESDAKIQVTILKSPDQVLCGVDETFEA